jgi:streptogramin lyase
MMRFLNRSFTLATFIVATCFAATATFAHGKEAVIETVAGTGNAGDNGREGPALETNIDQPFGLDFGPDGALYICEVGQHRVRRLDLKAGRVTTVAGAGRKGYAGDGGSAQDALLNEPYEVRFNAAGDMYFVEMRNQVVRRVDGRTGTISTVAGNGRRGYAGDGGPANAAELSDPHSIAFDGAGRLLIADIGNHRIRRVDLKSGQIESIAGNGKAAAPRDGEPARDRAVLGPRALAVEGDTLWVALREGNSVWKLDLRRETWRHVAGAGRQGYKNGPAAVALLAGPKGIALADQQVAYIVDTENNAIRTLDARSGEVGTLAGLGPKSAGYGGDGPAKDARFDRPHGICVGPDGAVYIGDTNNHRVRRILPAAVR